jgi:signal transduction histidine kinase/ActR/RegA family two-component response regulator
MFLTNLFDTTGFTPRWECGAWSDTHGWLHILSDTAIFGAYFAIPLVLVYFVSRRKDVPFMPVFWLFALFILSCGIGHLIEATLFWHPWYRLSGLVKLITAVVSWATVIALIPLVPKALALPGLARMNAQLKEEIARRERAERERLELEQQIQKTQKLESLGVLAGGIAHDFNNLLSSIMGYADLARLELAAGSPAKEFIEEVLAGSTRAAELTSQMLAYSGKGRFVVEPVLLPDVVNSMTRLLQVSISKKHQLQLHATAESPIVEVDVTQLRQVVMNLIINASEAIGGADGTISVVTGRVHCTREVLSRTYLNENLPEGDYAFIEVADTGCGMTEVTKARVFDPFFTTKFIGRGLGLAAVLGIVRGHRGAIVLESEVGKGTRFRVLLPISDRELTARAPSAGADSWRGTGTVLIVDDEDSVREVASAMVQLLGFETLTAADGRAGVEAFSREPDRFTLVLLDMTMPHLDGEEALHEIRGVRPNACIILSSGYSEQAAVRRFADTLAVPTEFIQKPYRLDDLRKAIRKALESRAHS